MNNRLAPPGSSRMALTRASRTSLEPVPCVTPVIGIVTKSFNSTVSCCAVAATGAAPTINSATETACSVTHRMFHYLRSRHSSVAGAQLGHLFAARSGEEIAYGDTRPETGHHHRRVELASDRAGRTARPHRRDTRRHRRGMGESRLDSGSALEGAGRCHPVAQQHYRRRWRRPRRGAEAEACAGGGSATADCGGDCGSGTRSGKTPPQAITERARRKEIEIKLRDSESENGRRCAPAPQVIRIRGWEERCAMQRPLFADR